MNYLVYSLPVPMHPLLFANLECLLANADEHPFFAEDLKKRSSILRRFAENQTEYPQVVYQSEESCIG